MVLNPLSDGSLTGTGTLAVQSGILGAVLVTADSSVDVTVKVYKNNSSGPVIYQIVTKLPIWTPGPIRIDSQVLYYDVSGSGGAAQFFEWVE